VFAEMSWHLDYIPMRAVRTERWKYIRNYSSRPVGIDQLGGHEWAERLCAQPDQPWLRPRVPDELYDLERDPQERTNLAGRPEHAEVQRELEARLDRHMAQTADPLLGEPFAELASAARARAPA
jgi:arylsulfatase A-like enzyme